MIKTLLKLFPALLILLLFAVKTQAQSWLPLGPDDNNEAFLGLINYNNIITSPDGVPYIVYADANSSGKLTVKKFDGQKWTIVGTAGFTGGTTGFVSMAVNGITPYVAFSDISMNNKVTVMKFDGSAWVLVGAAGFSASSSYDMSLSFNGNTPYLASGATVQRFDGDKWVNVGDSIFSTGSSGSGVVLAFDNDIPYIAYLDYTNSVYKATLKKFIGSSWVTIGTPGILPGGVSFYEFVFYKNTPFLAYTDNNNNYKLSVKTFDGNNWVQLGNTYISTNTAAYISIASNGTPYVAYEDGGLGGKATVKKYSGQTWVTVGTEGFSAGPADYTSIALSGNTPYISFRNLDTKKGTAMMFNGSSWVVTGSSGSISNGAATYTSLALNNNTPYVAYSDAGISSKVTVKKYNGANWELIGSPGISAGQAINNSLIFNGSTPYLSYSDISNGNKATVMKFDGNNWSTVGPAGISSGTASYVSLAFNGTIPYIAYADYGNSGKVSVKKFDGNAWQTVGAASISAGAINSMAFGINGTDPYVAYADNANGGNLIVMKFDGTAWTVVGGPSFSAGATTTVPLAFDGTTFYAAYTDPNAGNKLSVKKFNGSNWVNVGSAGLSDGVASYVKFAFNGNIPYITYADDSNGGKIIVKQFDGSNWITIGTSDVSAGKITSVSTSIATSSNKVYIAYDQNGLYVKSFANSVSTSAQLSNLILNAGTLSPTFVASTNSYTVAVPNSTNSITITPTAGNSNASIKVNTATVSSGGTSAIIPLSVGNNTITIIVTAQDDTTTQTYTLTVNRAQDAQTITFAALPAKTYGDADFALGATSSSGLPVSYATSNPAVAIVTANGFIHLVSAGTTNITASQAGNSNFLSASDVSQTLTVAQTQNPGKTLTWKPLGADDNSLISGTAVTCTSIITDASGVPYIAFTDSGNGGKVTVKRFDGVNWQTIGSDAFSTGGTNYLSLAINNNTPYIAYADAGSANKTTMKKFDGNNWITIGTEGFSNGAASGISLVFNGNIPYVAYTDASNNNKTTVKLFNGSSWVTVGLSAFSTGMATNLSLTFYNGIPYAAYIDYSYAGGRVTVKRFDGANWITVGTEGFSIGRANNLTLGFNGSTPYVAYNDSSNSGYAMVMRFNGTSWVVVGSPGFTAGIASYVLYIYNNSNFYAAYTDASSDNKLTIKKFDGSNWATIGTAGFTAGQANYTSLGFSGSTPYIAYADASNGGKATVQKFNGSNWVTVGLSYSGAILTSTPSLTFSGNTPYIAYPDRANGSKATVKKYDGNNWITIGTDGITPNFLDQVSLAVDNGTPYIFYGDLAGNSGTGGVMKFDGSKWLKLGLIGFTQTNVTYPNIKINNGVPYVAYQAGNVNGGNIVVRKFTGTEWVNVGSSLASNSNYPSLAFNGDSPYVIYADGQPSATFTSQAKATVKKFDGTNWVTVGGARFSSGRIIFPSIIFNGDVPYISYTDYGDGRATVQKFDGTRWVTVNNTSFLSGTSATYNSPSSVSLALVGDTPYAAYQDGKSGGRATVSRFDGSNWIKIGSPFVTAGAVGSTSLMANNNKLYLAYSSGGTYVKYFDLPASSNAKLANLALNTGALAPLFSPDSTSYITNVSNETTSITVTPTIGDASATITVNGSIVPSGTASAAISLANGFNQIKTVVTAQDGTTQKIYTINVNRAKTPQVITFATIPAKTYSDADFTPGAASNNTSIPITYRSSDPAVATIVDGKVHLIKAGTVNIIASQAADNSFLAATDVTQSLVVKKASLAITADDQTKIFGAANPILTVSYTGFVSGDTQDSLSTKPTASTIATATSASGVYPITVTGATSVNYDITYVNGKLTIGQANQAITFASIPNKTFGDADFTLIAKSSSVLPVSYVSSNPLVATIDTAGVVHITSAGTATITASQAGNGSFIAAASVTQILTVKKALLIITVDNQTKAFGAPNPALTVTYNGFVSNDTSDSLSAKPTISTTAITGSPAGTYPITASGAASTNYEITYQNGTLTIGQTSQAISFEAIPAKTYGDTDFVLAASASSGLPVKYTSSNPLVATVNAAGTLHLLASGSTTITASQAGNENYNAANFLAQTLVVNKASLTITANNQTKSYGAANPALDVAFAGFVNGDTPSILSAQPAVSTIATANTDAGVYPLTPFGADAANYSFVYVPGKLTITQISQTISFASMLPKAYGDADFNPEAAATSGLPVSYTSSNPAVIAVVNGKLHIAGAGTAQITASQNGNVNYLAAVPVSQDVQVIFTLPANNFKISATGESCKNSSNGEINITAASNLDYTAVILIGGINKTYPFNGQLAVKNLPAGKYPVCITMAAYPEFKQCFEVTVATPKDLSVYSVVNPASGTVTINLSGSSSYNISLNGASFTTTKSSVALPLAAGKNTLSITTANICQGVYEKTIELPASITAYPNPFESKLSLSLANDQSLSATGYIYNMQGKMIYSSKTNVNNGTCSFDLSSFLPGSYVLKLVLDHSETNIKIFKK